MKFDIDIDVKPDVQKEKYGVRASIYNRDLERFLSHPSGLYINNVPIDPLTGRCAIPYDDINTDRFFKIDLLTNTTYNNFNSKQEVATALEANIDWSLLTQRNFVEQLPHLSKHFELIQRVEPNSVDDLADLLALIRPGKVHLIDEYLLDKEKTRRKLYQRPPSGIYFKKSHAYAYALSIKCLIASENRRTIVW
jgi:hypothetical protein